MGGFAPPLNSLSGTRHSERQGRYRGVIRCPPWGAGELQPPEGLVSFAERLPLRDANVFEEVVIVALGDLAECTPLPRGCNPLADRRIHAHNQAADPCSLTSQADNEGLSARRRSARNSCRHAKGSGLSVEPGRNPTERSQINRSRYRQPAKNRFSGTPEVYS
jgi:hypothetical protein